jgi:hypothetical protein
VSGVEERPPPIVQPELWSLWLLELLLDAAGWQYFTTSWAAS